MTTQSKINSWFKAQNRTDEETILDIDVYDEIGGWGVSANELVEQIRDNDATIINVHMSSPGGDAFQGLAIMNALRRHKAQVNMHVDGLAASAASIIAMGGDHIKMNEGSIMMIHHPFAVAGGNAKELRDTADFLDKLGESMAEIYMNRSGHGTPEYWSELMNEETRFTATEAYEIGLADETFNKSGKHEPKPDDSDINSHKQIDIQAELDEAKSIFNSNTADPSLAKSKYDPQSFWESLQR